MKSLRHPEGRELHGLMAAGVMVCEFLSLLFFLFASEL